MARSLLEPRWILGALLALVVAVGCASLGMWQLRRLDERRAFNASVERAVKSVPIPLSQAVARANDPIDLAYRRVSISGTYDPEHEVVVFGRTLAGRTGSEVLTPLVRGDGVAVMVDRGWVPLEFDTPPVAGAPPPPGRVQADGILWPPEAEGEADAGAATVTQLGRIDLERLRAQLPYRIEPVYVRLLAQRPANPLPLPKPVPLPALDEGPHLSYAVQWFIFGSIAVIGYGVLASRELRERAHHESAGSRSRDAAPRRAKDADNVTEEETEQAAEDSFDWHPDPELVGFRDPRVSRRALEELGSSTWAAALDYLYVEAMRRPVRSEAYSEGRRRFFGDGLTPAFAPTAPTPADEVLGEFRRRLAPHQYNAAHPRSFSYFTPPPLPMSIAGEVLAQWVNQGVDVWHAGPSAAFVEEEVVAWLRQLLGFTDDSWGVLTSGGVMANIMAMTIARDRHLASLLGTDEPPRGRDLEGVRVYASDQTHFSIARALDVLGYPPRTLHLVPSDERFRLHGADVAEAIRADRGAGLLPLAISAVAGSTNTGSVDLTGELADVARDHGLWLHVDAAYGGAARLSKRDAGRVPDLNRADSVTIDPHKWFFQAYDIGALVVKRRDDLMQTFHRSPEYYRSSRPEDEPLHWYQFSIEGTRRFRALKLWLSWKHLGTQGFGRLVERNDDLAAYLAGRCRDADDFEPLPLEPELSVVCFRHLPGGGKAAGLDPALLDAYQDALQRALELSGEAWVSTTTLRGRTYLRAGVMNYLSNRSDVDAMLDALRRLSPEARELIGIGHE